MSRPKKQKKTVQERKRAAAERAAAEKKKSDQMTYVMLGVIGVIFVAMMVKIIFF